MQIISFDALRTLDIPDVTYIKPECAVEHLEIIQAADWLLFPAYWQVNSLHYGLHAHLFPSIASYHLGYNKIEMTRALQLICPKNIPRTEILPNTTETARNLPERFCMPFVAKTPRSSEGAGVFLIQNRQDWQTYCDHHDILYVQEYLPVDRDLRLVVIGSQVVASYWRLQSADGFHNNIAAGGQLDFSAPPATAVELVAQVAQTLGIDHAGFDIAMHKDHPYIFEFNRLFGNNGLSKQGIKPGKLIYAYLLEKAAHTGRR